MPSDVSGLVTPVYSATLPVTNDTEVLTQAALTDTTVSLANRIEFLRQLVDDAADMPEASATLREEFWSTIWDPSGSRLEADNLWRTAHAGSPVVVHEAPDSDSPGVVRMSLPTSSEFRAQLGSSTGVPFSFITTEHCTFRIRVDDHPGNIASSFRIGLVENNTLQSGGTNSLSVCYFRGVNATQWLLQVRKASVTTLHAIKPFINGDYETFRFVKSGNDILVRDGDNNLLHTVLSADRPLSGCNLGWQGIATVADAVPVEAWIDFIFARSRPAARQ
jgi:hypothetical protein